MIQAKLNEIYNIEFTDSTESRLYHASTLEKWFESTKRNEVTLVTAGRSGVGKSTLIGNILKLSDKDTGPKCLHSPSSFDKEVQAYSILRGGVSVRIVDTPDITDSDVNDSKAIAELQEKTGGKCDALLYCVSLLPDSKIDKSDEKLMKKLTRIFGEEMWKHTILVLTFTNVVKALYPDQNIEVLVDEYAQKFQSVIRRISPSFSVVSIYSCDHGQTQSDPLTIVALPAGKSPDESFVDNLLVGWDETIFLELLKKSDNHSMPVILKSGRPEMPRIVRHLTLLGGFVVGTGVMTTVGVATCYYFGKTIGLFMEQFIKKCDFVYSFPTLGLLTGVAVIGPWSAVQVITDVHKYEAEQDELERVQKEVEQYRKTNTVATV